jgi:hypothetical protein
VAGVSEVWEVTASGPDGDFDLGEHAGKPLLVAGLEGITGDDEIWQAGIAHRCEGGCCEIGELFGGSVEEFPPVADDEFLSWSAGRAYEGLCAFG